MNLFILAGGSRYYELLIFQLARTVLPPSARRSVEESANVSLELPADRTVSVWTLMTAMFANANQASPRSMGVVSVRNLVNSLPFFTSRQLVKIILILVRY